MEWREGVARTKRAAFADWTYWGRPVPGFGAEDAKLLIIGLASQPESVAVDDGLELYGVRITAPVHCAPPENKPTPAERDACRPWLVEELTALRPGLRAIVVLGAFGWQATWPAPARAGWEVPRPRPAFGHGVRVGLDGVEVFGCFHVSRRNTFTGRLTPEMLRGVLRTAARAAGLK